MTLAVILLVGMMCAPSAVPAASRQNAPQSAPATSPPEAAAKQDQATAPAAQNPPPATEVPPAPAKSTKTPSGQTHPTTQRSHHKKRVLPPCDSTPTAGQAPPTRTQHRQIRLLREPLQRPKRRSPVLLRRWLCDREGLQNPAFSWREAPQTRRHTSGTQPTKSWDQPTRTLRRSLATNSVRTSRIW